MPIRRTAAIRAASLPSLRAVGFGAAAVPVSAVSHCLAGGEAPGLFTAALAWVLVAVAYRLVLARTERSWVALATTLTLIQVGLHQLWSSDAPTSTSACHLGPDAVAHADFGHGSLWSGRMLLAHALAGAVLGWVLRCGEAALWSTARHLVHRVHHVVPALRALCALGALRALTAGCTTTAPGDCLARWHAWPTPWLDPAARRHRASGGRYWRGPPVVRTACAAA